MLPSMFLTSLHIGLINTVMYSYQKHGLGRNFDFCMVTLLKIYLKSYFFVLKVFLDI